jgi:hypothetical protein
MSENFQYYRDFGSDLRYRWDGDKIFLWEPDIEEWVDDSDTWFSVEDLNDTYEGGPYEAVPTDAEGNRL